MDDEGELVIDLYYDSILNIDICSGDNDAPDNINVGGLHERREHNDTE